MLEFLSLRLLPSVRPPQFPLAGCVLALPRACPRPLARARVPVRPARGTTPSRRAPALALGATAQRTESPVRPT